MGERRVFVASVGALCYNSGESAVFSYKDTGGMLTKERKQEIIQTYQAEEGDTGSVEVQVALLTERIRQITEHLRKHPKDKHSRLGLLKLVGQRARLSRYLSREDGDRYRTLISRLGLRR